MLKLFSPPAQSTGIDKAGNNVQLETYREALVRDAWKKDGGVVVKLARQGSPNVYILVTEDVYRRSVGREVQVGTSGA